MKNIIMLAAIVATGCAFAATEWWAVPPMNGEMILPSGVPKDGVKGGTVKIVAAKGEYEPGSFVVRSDADLGKVRLELGEFKLVQSPRSKVQGDSAVHLQPTPTPTFPKANLDLKVLKVWLQNKNAWITFFADTGTKPCPELLLNDEDLIRVDYGKQANYARVKGADGKTTEWWLNPPRLMDKRYYDHYRETTPFQSMKPGFADAKTLQPVALMKGEAKQFFLTAHVTPDIPAGVYKGEVRIKGQRSKVKGQTEEDKHHCLTSDLGPLICTIPVAIKVLDFTLPKPKAYIHPEMDFLVCFYNYHSPELILKENGGDRELMKRQMEAIMVDELKHGQDMHWIQGGAELEIMKKVGMRTNPVVGGVPFVWNEMSTNQAMARAYRVADHFDKVLGHHNIFGAYGDEPGQAFFLKSRNVFDCYQKAGLKFIIASRQHIVDMVGYKWDWHNASEKPTQPKPPRIWNEMGSDTHCAWYADQHVGCENPEFNRRQNGMGAWLSGYSALCNYAHHLGPYNDESDTYKPMVFAYGTADGVIDTIQWEGFREGIDDIRYATLMCALAREANKSEDIDVRHLGRRAKVLLATFNRETGNLATLREEMIDYIEKLRATLGAKVADAITYPPENWPVTKRPELPALKEPAPKIEEPTHPNYAHPMADKFVVRNDLNGAVGVWERMRARAIRDRQHWVERDCNNAIAKLYEKFYQPEEGAAYLEKKPYGKLAAAGLLWGRSPEKTAKARALALAALDEALAAKPVDTKDVSDAWGFFLNRDDPLALDRKNDVLPFLKSAGVADAFLNRASGLDIAWFGNWEKMRRYYRIGIETDGANTNRLWSFKVAQYGYQAFLQCGDAKTALWFCDKALETAAKNSKRCPYKPEDVYFFELAKALVGVTGEKETAAALEAADRKFGAKLPPKARKERIERLSAFKLCAHDESFARGAKAYLDKIQPPFKDKFYTVKYSTKRIAGLGGWAEAAAKVKPETAVLDRAYGGNTEYLWTDVSTGRGEVTQDLTKRYAKNPEWQAMADDWGVHFRMEVFDEKAKDIALGFVSAGSLEGYIAPGPDAPYHCLLHSFKPGGFNVYNGVYSQKGHRWVSENDRINCREDIAYTEGSVIIYWAFSWDVYSARIPSDGTVWDFEPMLWGRKAALSWNGLKTVHGRATWGHLKFALAPAERRAILKKVLVDARQSYEAQKRSYAEDIGVIAHWTNPEVGDPAFYDACLKPIVEKLDAASKKVSAEMDDATVDELAKDALPLWFDFAFEADRLRAQYLHDRRIK